MSLAAKSILSKVKDPEVKTSKSTFVLNCIPSRSTEKDWGASSARAAGIHKIGAIPREKDLRASWWPVGNQGATGSCVGWAAADAVLRWHLVHAKKISQTDELSMRFIWMAAKESDEFSSYPSTFIESDGTSLKAALDIARKFGVVTDKILPFGSAKLFAGEVNAFYAMAAKLKIASYFNLGVNPQTWRSWIAHNGPILTRLDVDATWDNATATKGVLAKYQPKTIRGGHAVSIVGYTADKFIVRNSWGTTWGDKGFAYATDAYATAAFSEAYGVSV